MSKGKPLGTCRTCRCEIVETVNDGVFEHGECVCCEKHRYETQPILMEALKYLLQQTVEMDLAYGIELTEGESDARTKAIKAIAHSNGEF